MNKFNRIAYALFGKYTREHQEDFDELRLSIKQARIGVPVWSDERLTDILSILEKRAEDVGGWTEKVNSRLRELYLSYS